MAWYVARTKKLKEHQAAASLADRGVETYLPMLQMRKARAGRRSLEPLFPCYLFARLEIPSGQWLAARSAPQIGYFLGDGWEPTPLPEDFVPRLMSRIDATNRQGGVPRFKAGETVIVTQGPFKDLEAVFDHSLTPGGRSRVLVQFLCRLVRVVLPEDALQRAG